MLVPKINKVKRSNLPYRNLIVESGHPSIAFYNTDILFEEKDLVKFIKYIERKIRKSVEYKNYLYILKNELNLKQCTFLPGLNIDDAKFTLEFHHYPFTLFDLVSLEVRKMITVDNMTKISPFEVADKVMQLHYKNLVGLVPLSLTVHKLAHEGLKFINTKYVIGNYKKYVEKCKANGYFLESDDEYLSKLMSIEEMSRAEDNGEDVDGNILDIQILKMVVDDIEEKESIPVKKEDIA